MRIIKKYSNRRLYDTAASRYINLEELAALVRGGDTVKVLDAKTGEELTRGVLLQVILDTQGGLELFPTGLLHRIIRGAAANPMHRVMMKQMGVGLEMLDAQLGRLEAQWGWMAGMTPPSDAPPPPDAAPSDAPPRPDMHQAEASPPAGAPAAPPPQAAPGAAPDELAALRERLARLERRLRPDD